MAEAASYNKSTKNFYMKLEISITTELFEVLYVSQWVVLDYFDFRFNPWDGFRLFFCTLSNS